uniref:phosphatidylinositol-3,5-bisphosphate 3-phosphatase n=1 Tax=Mola mola TaxID=94237 RepID=A0A3Q3VVL3_MOLML
ILEYIKAKDLFPQKELVKEDESLQVPFPVLQGEGVEYLGHADEAIIAISNYRLHIKFKDSVINVPLRLIESAECRDMFQLQIICKDSKIVRCHFATFKQCQEWAKRLNRAIAHPSRLEDLFALAYHAWCLGGSADDEDQHVNLCRPGDHVRQRMEMEVKRMGFDTQNAWRLSDINCNYKLCSSYPQKLLVPIWITDKELESVASFRSWKRIPVVVYRYQKNGAVIARCSQPEISWWGWRNKDDEYLVTSIAKACQMGTKGACRQRGEAPDSCDSDFDSFLTGGSGCDDSTVPQKLLILDARSYTAAVANRAKGGGCECEEYYPNCEVMFMGMANIHAIRNSFQALRTVCSQIPDPGNWLSALESTRWLQHLSVMLKAATLVCSAVEREGRPVLVHCSDGWDRTPQIVALAKILLDPYYRTLEGFQVLVEIDWLDYGHKFGDRCGHQENTDDVSEQCPVFLQWLDCVHQLLKQFPCLFEFNEAFLVKMVQHTYSCLYGTFLCNNACEREARNIYNRTCSVWSLLRSGNKNFQNFLYIPSHDMVLQPVCHTRALQLWTAVYLPTSSPCTAVDDSVELYFPPSVTGDELTSRSLDRLPKTRSMDNLLSAFENGLPLTRTSSDPNLNKHCQEGRLASEPSPATEEATAEISDVMPDAVLDSSEGEPQHQSSANTQQDSLGAQSCEVTQEDSCLTTQPLPSLPFPPVPLREEDVSAHTPDLQQAFPQVIKTALPPPPLSESPCMTAKNTNAPSHNAVPCLPLPCNGMHPAAHIPATSLNGHSYKQADGLPESADLLALQLSPLLPMEDSTETLTGEGEPSPVLPPTATKDLTYNPNDEEQPEVQPQVQPQKERLRTEIVKEREHVIPVAPVDCTQGAVRHLYSQSQLSDLSLLGFHWESVQGLVQSASSAASHSGVSRALQPNTCQSRRLATKLLRFQGLAVANGLQCCRKEALCCPSRSQQPGLLCAARSGTTASINSYSQQGHQLLLGSYSSPSTSSSPPPLQAPAYLDDDGLPVPMDAVQQRLRQIEAGYKQEVEVLRQQVRQLQMRLESKQYSTPPSEPDIDYEDDITCLRESDNSNEEDSLSTHSEDRMSEGSWDRVERRDTEVTRWVPDHMASHCFNCDCEFWIAKRRHHCRNCGNVFCKDCCHLKLPIPDQQLYDPVLVCNTCYDLLLESRTREIRSQQLKKAIATASS